ncbi:hypothetical protein [Bacillus spongiae]|uniref:hypothetical protein n=1 Tax=Bacillus spongiae TaxID=2683610 RepID=UPI003014F9D8
MKIKRFLIASMAYLATGIGFYHTFLGNTNIYGVIILFIGLLGVLIDIKELFFHESDHK